MMIHWKRFLLACLVAIAGYQATAQTTAPRQADPYKPPRYWSTYEYNIIRQHIGTCYNYIPESALLNNVNWVDANLKKFGYKTIQIDGWGDSGELSPNGYRTTHSRLWKHDFAWWSAYLQSRGMRLGMYVNPLWIHVNPSDTQTKVVGTNIPVSSLIDNSPGNSPPQQSTDPTTSANSSPNSSNPCGFTGSSPSSTHFTWADVNKPGAEQYVKGYIKFYADMGIKFIKVDFMAWYETGFDHYLGQVGTPHSHQDYVTALRWMREAADQNGVYFSITMANLFNEAQVERQYAHSIRVNEDVDYGEWYKFSDKNRGQRFNVWSQWANAMDGFTYWSYISGQNKVRLDGDFIRMNTYATDSERRTVISGHLMAGGLVGVTDQYNTIGNSVWVYQNPELLALNADDFVGHPITNDPTLQASQIWTGKMSNGDTIVGLFNRELTPQTRSISFADIGVPANVTVRDLWQHADLGEMSSLSVNVPPHGSMVVKLSNTPSTCRPQSIIFNPIPYWTYNQPPPAVSAMASSGLPVLFEVALGPAIVQNNQVLPTGQPGMVHVVAKQAGDAVFCAAIPEVQSFYATGPHQDDMFLFGTFTSWTPIRMKLVGGVWVADNVSISAGPQQLKFANTNNFTGTDWGDAQGLTGTAMVTTGGKPNIQFFAPVAGSYRFTFNDITLQYAIQEEPGLRATTSRR